MHNFTRCFTHLPTHWLAVLLINCFITGALRTQAQQPAFPGAEGAGMYTTGGRGSAASPTTVFEVTNLNDDNNPGSLRYALTAVAANRTIVFRVSGTIHLNTKLNIRDNVTIAGQTAPGDGICVADYPVVISGSNVIVRYMRFRLGDKNQKKTDALGNPVDGSGGDDAFGGLGVNKVIIDHCSVSWSDDECLTIYRGDSLTIQYCFITEPLNYSYHFEAGDANYEQHGYGGIQGSKHGTIHHNLFADCRNRNPRFAGISTYTPSTVGIENVDYRNNLLYNWGINTVYGGEGGNYNVVNNYYKWGPNTSSGAKYRICNPSHDATSTIPFGKWFVNGNYVDGSVTNTNDNWSGVFMDGGANPALAKVTTPFDLGFPVTTHAATDVYDIVLQNAGAILPRRDTLDQRIVNDVRNRTGRIIDVQGGYPHGTDYSLTVNAWPTLNSTTAPTDTDHDGMPDSWETSHGLNPGDASDRNVYDATGYTMLENYLNGVTSTNTDPVIAVGGSFTTFSQAPGAPSASQTYTVAGYNLTSNITITAPAGYELSTDGTTWFGSANPIVITPTGGTVNSQSVFVRLNAGADGTYAGNITHTSTGAATVNLAITGIYTTIANGLGASADMDGGFEKQPAGANTAIGTTAPHTSTALWEAAATFTIATSGARTGSKYYHFTQTSTSNKYAYTPVLTTTPLAAGTSYMMQFWYRVPSQASATTALSGFLTTTAALGGAGVISTATASISSTTPVGTWIFFSCNVTSPSATPTSTYAGFKINNPQSPFFDIDDFVVYPGTTVDATAPDAPTSPTASGNANNKTITVNWTAPSTGVDGGGYVVVRSTSSTAPVPNANGVYIGGNTMGAGYTVVYLGTNTTFTDADPSIAADTRYYYYIFTADKAYNYCAAPASVNIMIDDTGGSQPAITTSGSLTAFAQTKGSPSAVQTITVSGANLTNDITIAAPANFELSTNNGTTWSTSPVTLTASGGTVSATAVSIRLNAANTGAYSGNIVISSAGATSMNVAVSGSTVPAGTPPPAGTKAIVAKDGSGDYTSIQAAINAVPTGQTAPYKIFIRKGKYVEAVNIPGNKPFIQLIGESLAETIISYDNYSGKAKPTGGGTYGTSDCGTLIVNAADVMLMNLSIENATGYGINANAAVPAPGDGPQAVAVYTTSDRVVFYNCRFNGGQDTYYGGNNKGTRCYLKNCYIDGNTDFLFGSSTIIFDTCIIYPRTRLDNSTGGYVTAVNTKAESAYGYVFRDCKITKNRGFTLYTLGRPWQNDAGTTDAAKSRNKAVFLNTTMGSTVVPAGWSTWDAGTNTSYITYAEYNSRNYDGTAVNVSSRVLWSKQLTAADAVKYYNNDTVFINANTPVMTNWKPYDVWPELSTPFKPELSVSNLVAKKGAGTGTITWNMSWPMTGITCELYRSNDKTNFTLVSSQVSTEDSACNFSFAENLPPAGQTYYYIVRASKAGFTSITSDTALISSTPTITANGTLGSFLQGIGTPSGVQAYSVSGVNLLQNMTITPPAGYEISVNGGATWSASALALSPTGGSVANTTISVRLNGAAVGTYSGNITHTSSGAQTVNVAVSGTVQSDPLPVSVLLQQWPMSIDNQDSAAVRSAGVTASTPVFSNLYLSNGIGTNLKQYSGQYGQAFGASANGDGSWVPAPGANLNRIYYEQFTVTAAGGYKVRVDSLVLTTAFTNTSNGRMAVVYSKSGFVSDSANVTGGTGPDGALLSSANGGFTTPIVPANQGSGPTNTYALALNNATGVSLNDGEKITIRIYYAAGSTSAGRYAMLKNVMAKGIAIAPASLTTTGTLTNFTQVAGTPSAVQTYTVNSTGISGNITVTPPAGYQISNNGGANWFITTSPLLITPGTTPANTTITVRLNAASAGTYTGNITHAAAGITTQNVAVNGTTALPPAVITTGNSLNAFLQTVGKPADVQTTTVSITNVPGTITLTPPAGYDISVDSGKTWYTNTSALTLSPVIGSTISMVISVRLNASEPGTYEGNIVMQTSGTAAVNVPVTGIAYGEYTINPNPAHDYLNVYHAKLYTIAAINVYNMNGHVVKSVRSRQLANYTTINISDLPNGMYFVEMKRLDERVLLRFIKL